MDKPVRVKRPKAPPFDLICVDMFCGAGGFSSGLDEACRSLGLSYYLVAINHSEIAIRTHQANHPNAHQILSDVELLNPASVIPWGYVDLLIASPECTHHSNARGGKPRSDQSRASAWHVVHWASALHVKTILVENVKEFRSWGPLTKAGHPEKRTKGKLYVSFLEALKNMGYRVEEKLLVSADYGDPTTRERLFIMARKDHQPLHWPEPTHARTPTRPQQASLFAEAPLAPWRAAREIIDWKLQGTSIFNRDLDGKPPLAESTMRRIFEGLERFSGLSFTVGQQSGGIARSTDAPLQTVAAAGAIGVALPEFLASYHGDAEHLRSVEAPLPTADTANRHGLVAPFLMGAGGPTGQGRPKSVERPMPTVISESHLGLAEPTPYIAKTDHKGGHGGYVRPVTEPIFTQTTRQEQALLQPYLVQLYGNSSAESVEEPLPTVTAQSNHTGLAQPESFVVSGRGDDGYVRGNRVDEPLRTVTAQSSLGLVNAFLATYNGQSVLTGVEAPLPTVTSKNRFMLIELVTVLLDGRPRRLLRVGENLYLDVLYRMLEPRELAGGQGFPETYRFLGNKRQQTWMIGNAVSHHLAVALNRELIRPWADRKRGRRKRD